MEVVYIGAAAAIGAVGAGLLGWLGKKGEPLSARKLVPNLIRATIAGATIALAYPFIEQMGFYPGLAAAFLSGSGVDVLAHRVVGTMKG